MPIYYGLPYSKEQLVQLFADYHAVKLSDELTAEEVFSLIRLCDLWDQEGKYDDLEENINYLVDTLLEYEKEFKPYFISDGNDGYLIGFRIDVNGPISVRDIEAGPSEKAAFEQSPLYPYLYTVPHICYM